MDKKRLRELVKENDLININDDDSQQRIWNEMISLLSSNIDETIEYLNSASAEEIYFISSIYEDLSKIFQSQQLIECMKNNSKRTGVDCEADIYYAISELI